MQTYDFEIVLADETVATEELADRVFEAGCDDGTLYSSEGKAFVGFSREAPTLETAVRSALNDLITAGIRPARVESPDGPVYSQINAELMSQG